VWASVSIAEAEEPRSTHPFKGNIDVDRLEELLRLHGRDGIAFVRFEACLNMAGGQPFSMANLEAVRDLTRTYGVPLFLDATRSSENALFVKRRESGFAELPFREILRQIAAHSDGAVFSSKKDHFVPIGGLVAVNDDELAARLRELVVVYEGFPHYGGMSGAAMEALAVGIHEAADEAIVADYVDQVAYLASLLEETGVPIVRPPGAHAVFLDAKAFLSHVPQEQFPAQTLAGAIYLAGGIRTMERGIVSGQHDGEPYDGLELVRLTIPRRVYTQAHMDVTAEAVVNVFEKRERVAGLQFTYEPEYLRFFQARFEPVNAAGIFNDAAARLETETAGA
jgi:tyrosine phenol-lyase